MIEHTDAAKYLWESGLLFEINQQLLHSIGLSLSIVVDEEGEVRGFGPLLETEEYEGWYFDNEMMRAGQEKIRQFHTQHDTVNRLSEREAKLGWVTQYEGLP